MALLLDHGWDQITIIEEVIKAAAGNRWKKGGLRICRKGNDDINPCDSAGKIISNYGNEGLRCDLGICILRSERIW